MRTITLITELIQLSEEEKATPFDYGKQIFKLVETSVQGMSTDDIRQSCKIMAKIDALDSEDHDENGKRHLKLEDAEWNYLKKRLDDNRWTVASPAILNLEDAINNAEPLET